MIERKNKILNKSSAKKEIISEPVKNIIKHPTKIKIKPDGDKGSSERYYFGALFFP